MNSYSQAPQNQNQFGQAPQSEKKPVSYFALVCRKINEVETVLVVASKIKAGRTDIRNFKVPSNELGIAVLETMNTCLGLARQYSSNAQFMFGDALSQFSFAENIRQQSTGVYKNGNQVHPKQVELAKQYIAMFDEHRQNQFYAIGLVGNAIRLKDFMARAWSVLDRMTGREPRQNQYNQQQNQYNQAPQYPQHNGYAPQYPQQNQYGYNQAPQYPQNQYGYQQQQAPQYNQGYNQGYNQYQQPQQQYGYQQPQYNNGYNNQGYSNNNYRQNNYQQAPVQNSYQPINTADYDMQQATEQLHQNVNPTAYEENIYNQETPEMTPEGFQEISDEDIPF